jgi:tRNA pseudouridine(55) synthase
MKRFVVLDKKIGQTPLEALTLWKVAHPEYVNVPATYAGRLDPLASGKLLVLLGNECKRKDAYTGLDKEYEVSVLLDISTDTGDTLGLPTYAQQSTVPAIAEIREALATEVGTRNHQYPAFSSRTVEGVPLFLHALQGTLATIERPSHAETIHAIRLVSMETVTKETLSRYVQEVLATVPRSDSPTKVIGSDFRQDEIRAAWLTLFESMPGRNFTSIKIKVTCGSGAYMRTLAERIGQSLSTSAFAIGIHRTRIGAYRTIGPISFFSPSL